MFSYFRFVLSADWTHSEFFCRPLSCQHRDADSHPFSLEPCWYIACCCNFGDHYKDNSPYRCCQRIWLHKQDFHSCMSDLWVCAFYFVSITLLYLPELKLIMHAQVGMSLAQIGEFAFVLLSRASNLHLVQVISCYYNLSI